MKNEKKQERVVPLRLSDTQLEKCAGGGIALSQVAQVRYETVSAVSLRLISSVADPL